MRRDEYMTTAEAAEFITRATGVACASTTIRRWLREKNWRMEDVGRMSFGDRWFVERASLITKYRRLAERIMVAVLEEETRMTP